MLIPPTKYGTNTMLTRKVIPWNETLRGHGKGFGPGLGHAGRLAAFWGVLAILSMMASIAHAAAPDKPKLGLLLYSRGFEFMVALDQGAQREAKKLGVEMSVQDGQSDSQVQTNQVDDLLAQHVSAIIIAVANSKEMVPAIRRANQANVPVVAVDSIIGEGAKFVTYVGFDNAAGAKMAADYIVQNHKRKVLELQGALGAYHAQKRHQGFAEGLKASPDTKVIARPAEWQASNAQTMTTDALTADSDIDAIFSHNDEMIRGVVSALKQINKFKPVSDPSHIMIVGIDGTPLALQRIRNGEQDATVHQDPFEMGALAVRSALDALQGKEVPAQQLLPPSLITKENASDPQWWGNRFKP
ncbi:MAG TPA: sugar ABC transporter substrate-binding protein [Chthoniobacterales bacterium]